MKALPKGGLQYLSNKRFKRCTKAKDDRALDKREYLVIIRDNFCLFCFESYVVTPHLNRLDETVQMRGHNIWF